MSTDSPPQTAQLTHIAIVLDRSGSMAALAEEAIGVYNEQVRLLQTRAHTENVRVSLVTFGTAVDEPLVWELPPQALKTFTAADYRPEGMTAMYDAIGGVIDRFRDLPDAADPATAFLVVIVTDGEENNSKTYKVQDVAARVRDAYATGRWTFAVFGANVDLANLASATGIRRDDTMPFQASRRGITEVTRITRVGTDAFLNARKEGATAVRKFYAGTLFKDPSEKSEN